jgi:hypothetical protein
MNEKNKDGLGRQSDPRGHKRNICLIISDFKVKK